MTCGYGFAPAAAETPPASMTARPAHAAIAETLRSIRNPLWSRLLVSKGTYPGRFRFAPPSAPTRDYPPVRGAAEVPARRVAAPAALVQRRRRHAEPGTACPASRHPGAGRPGRPRAAVPDGADHAGGQRGTGDRNPRGDPRPLHALAADSALPRAAPRSCH